MEEEQTIGVEEDETIIGNVSRNNEGNLIPPAPPTQSPREPKKEELQQEPNSDNEPSNSPAISIKIHVASGKTLFHPQHKSLHLQIYLKQKKEIICLFFNNKT